MNRYKRVVDNKMRWQGDIDDEERIIRVNKKKSKKKSTVIDTIVHEEMHKEHPQMHEKTVRKLTQKEIDKMSQEKKNRYYNLFT